MRFGALMRGVRSVAFNSSDTRDLGSPLMGRAFPTNASCDASRHSRLWWRWRLSVLTSTSRAKVGVRHPLIGRASRPPCLERRQGTGSPTSTLRMTMEVGFLNSCRVYLAYASVVADFFLHGSGFFGSRVSVTFSLCLRRGRFLLTWVKFFQHVFRAHSTCASAVVDFFSYGFYRLMRLWHIWIVPPL